LTKRGADSIMRMSAVTYRRLAHRYYLHANFLWREVVLMWKRRLLRVLVVILTILATALLTTTKAC